MNKLERLGFAVAVSRWLEIKGTTGSVLSLLVANAPEIVALKRLADEAGLVSRGSAVSSLKVHICLLRAALRDVGHPAVLENVWGKGYRYVGDVAAIRAEVDRFA